MRRIPFRPIRHSDVGLVPAIVRRSGHRPVRYLHTSTARVLATDRAPQFFSISLIFIN